MKVLLIASSSGGHVYPCYSLGEYLKKRNITINYLGIKNQIEEKIYPHEISKFVDIPKSFKKSLRHPYSCYKTFKELNEYIVNFDVIIGFGGFITYFISRLPNIKSKLFYIHEANVIFGDSNKYSLKNAKKVFTSFKITSNKKYQNKIVLTGNPTVENITRSKSNETYISFVFGSLGSQTVLNKVIDYLSIEKSNEKFLLVTSKKLYEYSKEKLKHKSNVIIKEYVDRNYLYSHSKLIFIRGGASTLMEVIYSSTNAVCIPSPYVKHHHQEINAEYLFNHHAIMVIQEKELSNKKIEDAIKIYSKKGYPELEIKNQKNFIIDNPCFRIYQEIINDYKEKL